MPPSAGRTAMIRGCAPPLPQCGVAAASRHPPRGRTRCAAFTLATAVAAGAAANIPAAPRAAPTAPPPAILALRPPGDTAARKISFSKKPPRAALPRRAAPPPTAPPKWGSGRVSRREVFFPAGKKSLSLNIVHIVALFCSTLPPDVRPLKSKIWVGRIQPVFPKALGANFIAGLCSFLDFFAVLNQPYARKVLEWLVDRAHVSAAQEAAPPPIPPDPPAVLRLMLLPKLSAQRMEFLTGIWSLAQNALFSCLQKVLRRQLERDPLRLARYKDGGLHTEGSPRDPCGLSRDLPPEQLLPKVPHPPTVMRFAHDFALALPEIEAAEAGAAAVKAEAGAAAVTAEAGAERGPQPLAPLRVAHMRSADDPSLDWATILCYSASRVVGRRYCVDVYDDGTALPTAAGAAAAAGLPRNDASHASDVSNVANVSDVSFRVVGRRTSQDYVAASLTVLSDLLYSCWRTVCEAGDPASRGNFCFWSVLGRPRLKREGLMGGLTASEVSALRIVWVATCVKLRAAWRGSAASGLSGGCGWSGSSALLAADAASAAELELFGFRAKIGWSVKVTLPGCSFTEPGKTYGGKCLPRKEKGRSAALSKTHQTARKAATKLGSRQATVADEGTSSFKARNLYPSSGGPTAAPAATSAAGAAAAAAAAFAALAPGGKAIQEDPTAREPRDWLLPAALLAPSDASNPGLSSLGPRAPHPTAARANPSGATDPFALEASISPSAWRNFDGSATDLLFAPDCLPPASSTLDLELLPAEYDPSFDVYLG